MLQEAEAAALARELRAWPARVSSALLAVEAVRAGTRYGEGFARRAQEGLQTVALLPLDAPLLKRAATLAPATLRSLDALHLATALSIRRGLGAVFCYDARLAEAVAAAGLAVHAPR